MDKISTIQKKNSTEDWNSVSNTKSFKRKWHYMKCFQAVVTEVTMWPGRGPANRLSSMRLERGWTSRELQDDRGHLSQSLWTVLTVEAVSQSRWTVLTPASLHHYLNCPIIRILLHMYGQHAYFYIIYEHYYINVYMLNK